MKYLLTIVFLLFISQGFAQLGDIDFDPNPNIDEPTAPINMLVYIFLAVGSVLGIKSLNK